MPPKKVPVAAYYEKSNRITGAHSGSERSCISHSVAEEGISKKM